MNDTKRVDAFPISGKEARARKELIRIPPEDMLHTIRGKDHPVLVSYFVSNDFCHMGTVTVPTGEGARFSEPVSHKGDMVALVQRGPMTFFLPAAGQTFVVEEGDAMFIPEETEYQCVNYTAHPVTAVFMIAPGP